METTTNATEAAILRRLYAEYAAALDDPEGYAAADREAWVRYGICGCVCLHRGRWNAHSSARLGPFPDAIVVNSATEIWDFGADCLASPEDWAQRIAEDWAMIRQTADNALRAEAELEALHRRV